MELCCTGSAWPPDARRPYAQQRSPPCPATCCRLALRQSGLLEIGYSTIAIYNIARTQLGYK
eukprot:6212190-Pleurochrysis_carterae.AAC.3